MDEVNTALSAEWVKTVKRAFGSAQGDGREDFLIVCKQREWKVHKWIVAIHCPVLERMMYGPFKEAREQRIELPEDDPATVHDLISYIYQFDYNVDQSGVHHLKVVILADKYDVGPLKRAATSAFAEVVLVDFDPDYENELDELLEHVATCCEHPMATKEAYESILERIEDHTLAKTKRDDLQPLLLSYPDFAYDIVKMMREGAEYWARRDASFSRVHLETAQEIEKLLPVGYEAPEDPQDSHE